MGVSSSLTVPDLILAGMLHICSFLKQIELDMIICDPYPFTSKPLTLNCLNKP